MSSANRAISPALLMRAMARAARSVYQALPSAATASPSGSMLRLDVGSRSMRPSRTRPIASAWSMVNQMLPSVPAAIAIGASCGSLMRYSTNSSCGDGRARGRSAPAPPATASQTRPRPAITGSGAGASLTSAVQLVIAGAEAADGSARRIGAARRRDRCRAARPPPISTSTQNESPPARLIGSMRASRLPPSMAMRQTSA